MKRKLWWWFTFSPVIVGVLWILVSLFFWVMTTVGTESLMLINLKTVLNRWLWILVFVSIPLLIIGIVFLSTSTKKTTSFTVGEIIRYSRTAAKKNMKFFLLWFVVYIALQFISSTFGYSAETGNAQLRNIGITLVIMLAGLWVKLWFANLSLNIVHNAKANSDDVFIDFQTYIRYLGAYAIMYIIVIIWLILLIVPGIIFALRLSMIPYLIIDKKLWSIQAIKTSWKMTKGFGGTIFGLALLCGLINMLWILAIFVWLLRTIPLAMIATAYLYTKIHESSKLQASSSKPKAKSKAKA
jgi:hypothetical protein